MNLNSLKYIVEIAETGSINQAASNLFISQSALSTAVKNLEKEMGQKIFIRSSHGITPTPFGKSFINYVTSIELQLRQLDSFITDGSKPINTTLSFASLGYYFLTYLITLLYDKYKTTGIKIKQIENQLDVIIELVTNKSVNLGFINTWSCYKNTFQHQLKARHLEYHFLMRLAVAVTVGPKNPLFASKEESIMAKKLVAYPSVMYESLDYGPYSDIYSKLHLHDSGSRFTTSSRSAIYEILQNTDAYYLNSVYPSNPKALSLSHTYEQLRTIKLQDCQIYSEMAWIKRIDHITTPIEKEFIQLLEEYLLPVKADESSY